MGAIYLITLVCIYGYTVFVPGNWNIGDFFTYYTMVLLAPILYCGFKFTKKTKFIRPDEADLSWERPLIDAYEAAYIEKDGGFWTRVLSVVGLATMPAKADTTV